jgi:hypothetical protein
MAEICNKCLGVIDSTMVTVPADHAYIESGTYHYHCFRMVLRDQLNEMIE